ncbi:MAG: glycosyltransferase [Planctomycetes bacterium]|nr:glycosyltransferase [Planctomycetota bacterium]
MRNDNNLITVSIITGRYPENLGRALRSLRQAVESTLLEVYVIDNKAGFDVKEVVQRNYPSANIIKNAKPQGFGANHNQILKTATSPIIRSGLRCGSAKYILLLNDDIELGSKTIDLMYAFMEQHPDVGLSGSALYEGFWSAPPQTAGGLSVRTPLSPALKTLISSLVRLMGYYRLIRKLIGHQSLAKRFVNEGASLNYISGVCMLIRREAIRKIGLFDETFYMYLEDVDFGARAIAAGWKCYQVPGAKVLHHGFSSSQPQTYRWIARSAMHYSNKHHNLLTRSITFFLAAVLRVASSLALIKHIAIEENSQVVKNILVMRLGGIGDVVMVTPVLRALKSRFPDARITILTEEPAAEVIRGAPYVDEILTFSELYTYRKKYLLSLPLYLTHEYQLIKLLLCRKYDVFISLHILYTWQNIIRPLVIGYLSRARIRIGLNTNGRGWFLNVRIPDQANQNKHIIERGLDVARSLGADISSHMPEVWITEQDRNYGHALFNKYFNSDNRLLIGIHPGANIWDCVRKSWPIEHYARLADILAEKYGAQVILTGAKSEIEMVRKMASLMKITPIILAGMTTVKQLSALIEKFHLFITNDTGPMHMGVAMKTPTIGIFGPSNWLALGTYPPETNFMMVRKDINCKLPCFNMKCVSRKCFEIITVEDVAKTVDTLINKVYGNKFTNT